MKKIGFLGGTFDPIHNGHIEIARLAADKPLLDMLYFVPAALPPHKEGNYKESGEHRLSMAHLAAECDKRFLVSDFEFKSTGKSYSYLTMEYFKSIYPDDKLFFILGDEAYAQMDSWRNPERLREVVEFVVINRQNIDFSDGVTSMKIPPINISSTMIREKIRSGEDVSGFLPQKVYKYILENNLYKG